MVLVMLAKYNIAACRPGCKLTKQFLNKGSNNITDITKTVLIQRVVRDPETGKVFNQYQIASLTVIDPDFSKQLAKCPMADEKWNKEIKPDLNLMANPNTPTEQLPVLYDFMWLADQPQFAETWENGRPRRLCTKGEVEEESDVIEVPPSLPVKKEKKPKKERKPRRKTPRPQDTEGQAEPTPGSGTPDTPDSTRTHSEPTGSPNVDVAAIVNSAVTSALQANAAATQEGNNKLAEVLEKLSSQMVSLRTELKSKPQSEKPQADNNTSTSTSSRQNDPRKQQPFQSQTEEEDYENDGGGNKLQPFQQLSASQLNKQQFRSPGPASTRQHGSLMNYHFIQEQRRIDQEHHLRQEQLRQQQLFSNFYSMW